MYSRATDGLIGYMRGNFNMTTLLLILVVLMVLGAFPAWSHSRQWGYGPSGGLGLVLIVLVVLMLSGRI